MKKILITYFLSFFVSTSFACEMDPKTGQPLSHNHGHSSQEIHACYAWVRLTPPAVQITAAYLHLHNASGVDDTLISVSSPISQRIELHETKQENGIAQMRQFENGISLPNGSHVEMKPGGIHLMVMGLNVPLKEGEKVPFTLNFAKSKPINVQAVVMKSVVPVHHGSHHNH